MGEDLKRLGFADGRLVFRGGKEESSWDLDLVCGAVRRRGSYRRHEAQVRRSLRRGRERRRRSARCPCCVWLCSAQQSCECRAIGLSGTPRSLGGGHLFLGQQRYRLRRRHRFAFEDL